jgi:hypothetical protein
MPRERTRLSGIGLGRLTALLVVSVLALAGFWHLVYGASLITSAAVVAEASALLALAAVCARRWSR